IIKITSNFSLYNLAFEQTALGNYAQDNDETGKTINTMRRILIDILIRCQLSIYYESIHTGMGMEQYGFYIFNQDIILLRSNTQTISIP
ncbi:hypothetical protein, partial [Psychrobacter sp. AOP7-B1-24]|uniref:hypothetical protein n=1 Tax=Psychrobacter sp. AOP7-B1-24 TaxID=3457645 RepID=UPI00402BC05B